MVGFTKLPCFTFRNSRVTSVQQDSSRPASRQRDQRFDARLALRRDHRPHLHALVEAVADAQMTRQLGNRIAESLLRFADRHRDGNRQASLPGAAERAVADDLRGHLHVGIRQNDDVILRAALALGALALSRLPARRCTAPQAWNRQS